MAEPIGSKSSTGLDENIAGALCYALGFVTGIVFFVIEKDSRFVRFHAMQSIVVTFPLMIVSWVISFTLGRIPLVGWIISLAASLLFLAIWVFLIFKAYSGERFKFPIAGDIAERSATQMT